MTCQSLKLHLTHEEEQDISSLLEFINLTNLDDKSESSQHLGEFTGKNRRTTELSFDST